MKKMGEVKPMLLSETWDKSILNDDSKFFQVKENGVRALVHIKQGKVVGIRNRSNNPILFCFPEFRKLQFNFDTAILDAEICVFKGDKSVFYGGIDKRRSTPSNTVLQEYPATMVVFDCLKWEQENLLLKPYKYRYDKFKDIEVNEECHEGDFVRIAQNFDGQELWKEVVDKNLEGIVIKNPNAMYELGKRSKEYIKMKNYKLCEVLVERTEENSKGTKIFGTTTLNGDRTIVPLQVEAQLAGVFSVEIGTTHTIKYLDIVGNRLIQATKTSKQQIDNI